MRSLRDYINIVDSNLTEAPAAAPAAAPNLDQQKVAAIGGGAPAATSAQIKNPYTGADAEKFARLSPEDQAWYTKGGGAPDLNDPAIAARAPNKGQLAAAPAQAAAPAPGAVAAFGQNAGAAAPAAAPADDRNEMDKASDAAAAAKPGAAAAGAAVGGAAQAAAPANPAKPGAAAGAANPATGVNAQGQNVTMPDGTNPETGDKTAAAPAPAQAATPAPAAANRDAMPFGKAFADAKAKGEKEFTWKGKKYAVAMAKPAAAPAKAAQAATPAPAKQPGMWDKFKNWATGGGNPAATAGSGQISNTPAAENIQMNEFDMGAESEIGKIMKNAGLDSLNDEPTPDIPNPNKEAPGANIPNPPSFSGKADPKELLKNMPEPELAKLSGDEAKDLLMQMKKLAGM